MLTFTGTCWVYGPEISPLKYRHVAGSLGAAGEWFSTWIMVFGGGTGINAVGPKIFIWPLLCCFLAAAYVYFLCPETTGKTLEEIDVLFARSPEVRERLANKTFERRASIGDGQGPLGRRASMVSQIGERKGYDKAEKLEFA